MTIGAAEARRERAFVPPILLSYMPSTICVVFFRDVSILLFVSPSSFLVPFYSKLVRLSTSYIHGQKNGFLRCRGEKGH